MINIILVLLMMTSAGSSTATAQSIEWSSNGGGGDKDLRLTLNVETESKKSELNMSLDQNMTGAWTALLKLTRNWYWYTDTGRFFRVVPIRVAGCLGPQVLVMSRYVDSMQYEIYSVDQWWMPDVSINRTFYYRTKEIVDAKWKVQKGELVEIEVFAKKAMPEEEWASHPKKDGKTWVAHRVYHWDDDSATWKLATEKQMYYDLDNETMKNSLNENTKVWFAYK